MHQYQKRSSSPNLAAKAYQKKIANQQASMDAEERIEAPPEIDRNIMAKHHSMMMSKLMRMQAAQQQAGGEATSNISESLTDRPVEQFEQQKQADKAPPDGGSSNGKHQGKSSATQIDRNIMAKHHSMMMSKLMQMQAAQQQAGGETASIPAGTAKTGSEGQGVQAQGGWQQKADTNAIFSNGSALPPAVMAKYENLMPGVSLGHVSLHQGS